MVDTFHKAAGQHGYPASTLTDNGIVYTGMVYTVRLASRSARGGRTKLEAELRRLRRAASIGHSWRRQGNGDA